MNRDRRRFLGSTVMTIAAAQLSKAALAPVSANTPERLPVVKPGTNVSFTSLKQIDAGLLNVGYAEAGPVDGSPVVLLHGWPYDIHTYVDVAPLLASAGYRVIVPYLRGYGTTRFLSAETLRNGQPSALARDAIALMDALEIEKAIVAGCDWGARTADIVAALWPERCKALVSVSGYLIGSQALGKVPLPPKAELQWWYQYYFATERGRVGYEKYRRDFAKLIWQIASPKWSFDDATFQRSAAALENPDHVSIVIHSIGGGSGSSRASRSTTPWRSALPRLRSSPCRRLPWKVTRMARRTRSPVPMQRNSRASIRTGPPAAALGTTCRRKHRRPLRKRSWKSTAIDREHRHEHNFRSEHSKQRHGTDTVSRGGQPEVCVPPLRRRFAVALDISSALHGDAR
jgi:pimeloyl-ACP methyl ester carboxylesterase